MSTEITRLFELYVATSTKNDKNFLSPQHSVQKHGDRNGNGDDVFTGSNVKTAKRAPEHGYDADDDVKVHIRKNSVPKEQGHVREAVGLSEGKMNLSKVHHVWHSDDSDAKTFAKHYVAAMKGDHRETGPTEKDEKAADDFYNRYDYKHTHSGFAGSGTTIYTDKETGHHWKVDRSPNGKTFYGTDHIINKVDSMKEEVEQIDELSKVKTIGYDAGEDEKVYEAVHPKKLSMQDVKNAWSLRPGDGDQLKSKHFNDTHISHVTMMDSDRCRIHWKGGGASRIYNHRELHHQLGKELNESVDVKWNKSGKITSHIPTSLKKLHEDARKGLNSKRTFDIYQHNLHNMFPNEKKTVKGENEKISSAFKRGIKAGVNFRPAVRTGISPQHHKHVEAGQLIGQQLNKELQKKSHPYNKLSPEDRDSKIKERMATEHDNYMKKYKSIKEDVEQIDELSKETLASYIPKAHQAANSTVKRMSALEKFAKSIGQRSPHNTREGGKKGERYTDLDRKVRNKDKGIERASTKLAKEEVDVVESAFNRYVAGRTDAAPRKTRLEENLAVVAPKTRESILSMYETLSVENQDVMLDLSESIEGINELVDFVLTNGEA